MKEPYEMKGQGRSIRGIATELRISRNSVRKYLRSPGVPKEKRRRRRGLKLDPYTEYIDGRLSDGLENCVVLLRELRVRGYRGGYTILEEYVQPRRRRRQPQATMRFETGPGEQAQVDWGSLSYITGDGCKRRVWAFVMVLSWSRAIYVEFVRRADVATFMRCHISAFEYSGEHRAGVCTTTRRWWCWDAVSPVVPSGIVECWTSRCESASRCDYAGRIGRRRRGRWRVGSSTCVAICGQGCAPVTTMTSTGRR